MIAFIVHGARVRHPLVTELRRLCEADHALRTCEWLTTIGKGHATALTAEAVSRGATMVIAVGGDGTAHEVANGIVRSDKALSLIMGVFPAGSGNDLARSLGITDDASSFLDMLRAARSNTVDLIRIRCAVEGEMEKEVENMCINVADTGLGGDVARRVSRTPSWWNANLRYFLCGLFAILQTRKHVMNVEWRKVTEKGVVSSTPVNRWTGAALSVCFANFSTFGSGIVIAPHARGNDGCIALTIIGDVSVLDYLRWMPALRAGKSIDHPQVRYEQATSIRVHSDAPSLVEIDGEVVGTTPLEMSVLPHAVRMLVKEQTQE